MISASLDAWLRPNRTSQPKTRIMIEYSRRTGISCDLAAPHSICQTAGHRPAQSSEAVHPSGSVLASFGNPPPARQAKISRLFSARASDAGLRSAELELDALRFDVVQRLLPAALWPVVAGDSVGRPVLGGIERPETLVEAGGVEGRAQAGLDEAGYAGAACEQFLEPPLPLHAADRRCVRG